MPPKRRPAVRVSRLLLFLTPLLAGCGEQHIESHLPLLSDPDRRVRMDATIALIKFGGAAVEPVIEHARSGSDTLRYIAAQILGQIGDRRATPFLLELLTDSNAYVRERAVRALGQMDDPAQVPLIATLLSGDRTVVVREGAAWALGNLRDTTAVGPLVTGLDDTSAVVRRTVLASLQYLWTDAAREAALASLHDTDEEVVYVAAQLLGFHRTTEAVPELIEALHDSSLGVRTESARALGLIGDTAAVRPLENLFAERTGADHAAAKEALRHLTGLDYAIAP